MAAKRTIEILDILDKMYAQEAKCYLDHDSAWQLLIATIMSAQCTDARVNEVTKVLFVKYPSIEAFANADISELEQDIKSVGFYHNKARNIILCCKRLHTEYADTVPESIDELTTLAGVGRKTANVVRGNIYGIPSVVVDTHVKRISKRLGFTESEDPEKIEYDLMKKLPKDHWITYNHQVMAFGRQLCRSQNPKCQECPLAGYCRDSRQKAKAK